MLSIVHLKSKARKVESVENSGNRICLEIHDKVGTACYVFTLFKPHHKQHYYRTASFLYLDPTSPR